MARFLTAPEIRSYDVIDPSLAARVRIVTVPVLPPGADGMTIGRTILLRDDDERARSGDRTLLAHELVHVRQYAEHGFIGFLVRYVAAYLTNLIRTRSHRQAYLDIPFEDEARKIARRWADARAERAESSPPPFGAA